jgi:hypothetical protein
MGILISLCAFVGALVIYLLIFGAVKSKIDEQEDTLSNILLQTAKSPGCYHILRSQGFGNNGKHNLLLLKKSNKDQYNLLLSDLQKIIHFENQFKTQTLNEINDQKLLNQLYQEFNKLKFSNTVEDNVKRQFAIMDSLKPSLINKLNQNNISLTYQLNSIGLNIKTNNEINMRDGIFTWDFLEENLNKFRN